LRGRYGIRELVVVALEALALGALAEIGYTLSSRAI